MSVKEKTAIIFMDNKVFKTKVTYNNLEELFNIKGRIIEKLNLKSKVIDVMIIDDPVLRDDNYMKLEAKRHNCHLMKASSDYISKN